MAPVIVQATLGVASAILNTAGLSFIGLGIQPPIPEWGAMITEGRPFILSAWWTCAFPGLALAVTGTALSLAGEAVSCALTDDGRR